jgi:hypothetical protein
VNIPFRGAAGIVSEEAMNLLRQSGAMQTPHSGRHLFDHLLGTCQLLQSWGNPPSICLGGLFHSIYGTNAFAHRSLTSAHRPLLQAAIGQDAELLAWQFCTIDRPQAIFAGLRQLHIPHSASSNVKPEARQWRALAEIECANLIEQGAWGHSLRELFCLGVEQEGSLSATAMTALREGWAVQLAQKKTNTGS